MVTMTSQYGRQLVLKCDFCKSPSVKFFLFFAKRFFSRLVIDWISLRRSYQVDLLAEPPPETPKQGAKFPEAGADWCFFFY